jgi:hypothetical protein
MTAIKKRVVLHFPGFEPLNAQQHRARFERAAAQSAQIWNVSITSESLNTAPDLSAFAVHASGPNWATETHYYMLDLADHIAHLQARNFLQIIIGGYAALAKVIIWGGTWNYLRYAWRFALFSIFPFLLMGLGMAMAAAIVFIPVMISIPNWNFIWAVPLAFGFFVYGFLPLASRFHTLLLFNDWQCAIDFATMQDEQLNARLAELFERARHAFSKQADEYLIISHSIGGNAAVHVLGQFLEREPHLIAGKNIVFASLGSGILQCALLRPAKQLRTRVCKIAAHPNIFWMDVQCMTDTSNFYKTKVAELCRYQGGQQPAISFIRLKTMLTKERYARIKKDLLRVHRQYVLGNDVRANYDYAFMCAGPLPAATFAPLAVGQLPPIDEDGSIKHQ